MNVLINGYNLFTVDYCDWYSSIYKEESTSKVLWEMLKKDKEENKDTFEAKSAQPYSFKP